MNVDRALARGLVDLGVDTVFGLVGDANLFLVEAFLAEPSTHYVAAAHEGGAVAMANGYACATGRLGVATVTHGPGVTNTVTALVEAVRHRTPMVLIAGDTPAADGEHLQDIDQQALLAPTGAGFEPVRSSATAGAALARAAHRAIVERRPIVLDLPTDRRDGEVDGALPPRSPLPSRQAIRPDPAALDRAVGVIASARRPLLLAGRGAADPDARAALLALAEAIGAPVATTLKAKDLFRGEPHDLGIFGTLAHPRAAEAIVDCDTIVAFGSGLNRYTTADRSYLQGKRVVHCDVDPGAIGRHAPVDVAVVGDAEVVATEIRTWLAQAEVPSTGFRDRHRAATPGPVAARTGPASRPGTVDLLPTLDALDALVADDRILVTDGGRFVLHAWTHLHVRHPRDFHLTTDFGSIGLGMGTAVGVAAGARDRPVLLVTGDGGFMLGGLAELNTAVRHGLDLVVAVCNDGSYGAEHVQLRTRDMAPDLVLFDWPDLAPLAEALGGRGVTVREPGDLALVAEALAAGGRPLLIDIKLDPDTVPYVPH